MLIVLFFEDIFQDKVIEEYKNHIVFDSLHHLNLFLYYSNLMNLD